jgi:hypothetical protein
MVYLRVYSSNDANSSNYLYYSELTIEIHPKADKEEDDNKWKGVLLQMLKAYGKLKAESAVVWFII